MEFLSNHVIEIGLIMYVLGKVIGFLFGMLFGKGRGEQDEMR